MTTHVAVLGLGAMGRPIAEHLVQAGHPTMVHDLDRTVVDALTKQGAVAAPSLADLADNDVVLVVVPSNEDVRSACLGEDGLLSRPRPGSVLLICSSVTPETCTDVSAAAGKHDVAVIDAALTGGVRGAEAGRINLLVGGDAVVLDRVRPVLDAWTVAVHHLGPLGAGQIGKTVNNLCHWIQIAGVHEALLLGQRLGVAPSKLREALQDSSVHSGTMDQIELMRFTWWKKDIDNARLMAADIGYDLPLTETVYDVMPTITVDRIARLVADHDPDAPSSAANARASV